MIDDSLLGFHPDDLLQFAKCQTLSFYPISDGHIERCKREEELGVEVKDVPMVQPLNDVPTRLRRTSDMILATCQRISNLALL